MINLNGYEKERESRLEVSQFKDRLKRAINLMDNKEYKKALNIFENSVRNPLLKIEGKLIVLSLMARCCYNLKDYELAHSHIKAVMTHRLYEPKIEDFFFKIQCESELGKNDEAEQTFVSLVKTFPDEQTLAGENIRSSIDYIPVQNPPAVILCFDDDTVNGKKKISSSFNAMNNEAHCAVCNKKIFKPYYCNLCGQFLCGKHYLRGEHECIS
ncbi:MAG: hypothetical protein ACTSW1_03890 [Candidatus Hodarchaeales archaeon]